MSLVLARGTRAGARAWYGPAAWVDAVQDAILSLDGSRLLRQLHVSARAVLAVALVDARTATSTSGADVATAHQTVARRLRMSKSVAYRARRWIRLMRLAVVVAEGRYLTAQERRQTGGTQLRAASTRVLIHPQKTRRRRCRHCRDYLPRKGFCPCTPYVAKRSPNAGDVDNSKPMWAQRLAARIVDRPRRHELVGRHIGSLVAGLAGSGIPQDATADEVLTAVDWWARPAPSTPIESPLRWFLHQVRSIAGKLWDARDAPSPHVHSFRAILGPDLYGCLTCPETRNRPGP